MFHDVRVTVTQKTVATKCPGPKMAFRAPKCSVAASKRWCHYSHRLLSAKRRGVGSGEKNSTSAVLLETFLDRYKGSFFTDLARARIEEIKRAEQPTKAQEPLAIMRHPAKGTEPTTVAALLKPAAPLQQPLSLGLSRRGIGIGSLDRRCWEIER